MEAGKTVGGRLQWPRQEMRVAWTWVLAAGVTGSERSYYGYIEGGTNKIRLQIGFGDRLQRQVLL